LSPSKEIQYSGSSFSIESFLVKVIYIQINYCST